MPVINLAADSSPAASGNTFGPCGTWPIYWICDVSAESPALTGYAVSMATRVLWKLSGMQFGTCSITLRPCRRECYGEWPWGWNEWNSGWRGSEVWTGFRYWFPFSCGACTSGCSCTEVSEVVLPTPVNEITSVLVDGAELPTTSYRVDNNRLLVRTDGQRWPQCNDLNKDDTEAGTWSVTANYGQGVPDSARMAMGELACEIVKAGKGEDCRLPPGVVSLARQGVTIQYPDVGQLLKDGRTGLYLVDMFLAAENPNGLKQRARFYSVDRPLPRRAGT